MNRTNTHLLRVLRAGLVSLCLGWIGLGHALAQSDPVGRTAAANAGTVGVVSGGIDGTYVRIAADLASVLDDGDRLRVLPVIGRDGISQTISMVVSLQVNDSSKVEAVKELLPRLADAYLSDMYGNLTQASAMQGGVIKVSQLKARLTQITQKVAGEGMVDGVLLQVLQQHPG